MIDELYATGCCRSRRLADAAGSRRPERPARAEPNEFVVLHDLEDPSHTGLGRRLADTDHLIP
jgi:hypothetical protein